VNPRLDSTPVFRTLFSQYQMTDSLSDDIDVFESGYEYLLAYAAQGRDSDGGGPTEIRTTLSGMHKAASNIAAALEKNKDEFAWVVAEDTAKANAAISLVLKRDTISSEMVDNLNASIHVRALLTDLFLVSEAMSR
jgi:hypothetical protein